MQCRPSAWATDALQYAWTELIPHFGYGGYGDTSPVITTVELRPRAFRILDALLHGCDKLGWPITHEPADRNPQYTYYRPSTARSALVMPSVLRELKAP